MYPPPATPQCMHSCLVGSPILARAYRGRITAYLSRERLAKGEDHPDFLPHKIHLSCEWFHFDSNLYTLVYEKLYHTIIAYQNKYLICKLSLTQYQEDTKNK